MKSVNMWIEDYQWHYDYVRLAWDTGFSFEKCKSPHLDKNKICVVDIERIVKERDVASVDRFIPTVVQFILDEEQAEVLDNNFVKIFRISQLAVEYLLFCKKYLDNTVVLLKKELSKNREENKELKRLVDDLQSHIEKLTTQQFLPSFKCSTCLKAFSSQDYLDAHIKRRHTDAENNHSETDKLNMEIKELKERLNNTERLLKEKHQDNVEKTDDETNVDTSKLLEVLEKFDAFKEQVNGELRELRIQKSFYEENYGKLFDKVMQKKDDKIDNNDTEKAETTTQTDKILHIEHVCNKNVTEVQDLGSTENSIIPSTVETKIGATLAGIEAQMQSFWSKLNELEHSNKTIARVEGFGAGDKEREKPKVKPRSKFTQPTCNIKKEADIQKLGDAIEQLQKQQENSQDVNQHAVVAPDSVSNKTRIVAVSSESKVCDEIDNSEDASSAESDSKSHSSSSESESEPIDLENKIVRGSVETTPLKRVVSKQLLPSPEPRKTKALKSRTPTVERRSEVKIEKIDSSRSSHGSSVKAIINRHLQDLGISESWIRLPDRSFDKALEIINHQATLTKKTHPNINNIRKKWIDKIEKLCQNSKSKSKLEIENPPPAGRSFQNIVKVSYRPKSSGQKSHARNFSPKKTKEPLEIKNRKLFETDTESEEYSNGHSKNRATADAHTKFSRVVEEIKSLPKPKIQTDNSSEELNKDKEVQRGVLKSYPSFGSLSKKKVFFDLESKSPQEDVVVQKTGGSTTSVASSILEDKVDEEEKSKITDHKEMDAIGIIEKEFEDLSDFDLSDLETNH